MHQSLTIENKKYISTKLAAKMVGYTSDYVGQLYRSGKVEGKMVGRALYVSEASLVEHKLKTSPAAIIKKILDEEETAPLSTFTTSPPTALGVASVSSPSYTLSSLEEPSTTPPEEYRVKISIAPEAKVNPKKEKYDIPVKPKQTVPHFEVEKNKGFLSELGLTFHEVTAAVLVVALIFGSTYVYDSNRVDSQLNTLSYIADDIKKNVQNGFDILTKGNIEGGGEQLAQVSTPSASSQLVDLFKQSFEYIGEKINSGISWLFDRNNDSFAVETEIEPEPENTFVPYQEPVEEKNHLVTVEAPVSVVSAPVEQVETVAVVAEPRQVASTVIERTVEMPIIIQGATWTELDKRFAEIRDEIKRSARQDIPQLERIYKDISENDVDISELSDLTITGELTVTSSENVTIQNNLAVDSNTLFVDSVNNRVGIGTSSPTDTLSVNGPIYLGVSTPSDTTNRLYTDGTDIYWSGTAISSSASSWSSSGSNVYRSTGNVGIGTSSPYVALSVEGSSVLGNSATAGYFVGTTTATSTFTGGIATNLLNVTSTTASSTFANGINLASGCFAVNGTCITGGGSGSGTVNSGTTGQIAYYASDEDELTGTSTIYISTSERVGLGTVSPSAKLHIDQDNAAAALLVTGGAGGSSLFRVERDMGGDGAIEFKVYNSAPQLEFDPGELSTDIWHVGVDESDDGQFKIVNNGTGVNNGSDFVIAKATSNVGIGTSTPGSLLSLNDVANFTTATSTFYSTGGINLVSGCFAVNGTCITGGGSGSGTVNSGAIGQIAYYAANGTEITATSSIFIDTTGNIGIKDTTPTRTLDVTGTIHGSVSVSSTGYLNAPTIYGGVFMANDTGVTPTILRIRNSGASLNIQDPSATTVMTVLDTGEVGIGTTSPYAKLSVAGEVVASHFTATSTTATSTFAGGLSVGTQLLVGGTVSAPGVAYSADPSTGIYIDGAIKFSFENDLDYSFSSTKASLPNTIGFMSDSSLYLSRSTNDTLAVVTAGIERLRIDDVGNVGIGTTSPYARLSVEGSSVLGNSATAGYFVGTTTATSTFTGGIATNLLNVTSTTASSTFANGINLASGCFAVNGTCITGGGSGSGTVNSGTTGQIAYYASDTTAVSATSSLFISTAGNVGIGTTNPSEKLSVDGDGVLTGSLSLGSTPTFTESRRLKIFDDGVSGNARISLIGTSAVANGPALEFVLDGNMDRRALVRFDDFENSNYGLSFYDTVGGSVTQSMVLNGGNLGIGTTSPFAKLSVAGIGSFDNYVRASYFVATSTATSTFTGGIATNLLNVTSTTASSTFANGINLTSGCFAVNGTCITDGASQWTTTGSDIYYNTGNVGIGTTSPYTALSVAGGFNVHGGTFASTPTNITLTAGASESGMVDGANISLTAGNGGTSLISPPSNYEGSNGGDVIITGGTGGDGGGSGSSGNGGDLYLFGGIAGTGGTAGSDGNLLFAINTSGVAVGNVGIGTTSPYAKLSVEGSSVLGNSATAGYFVGTTTATSTLAGGLQALALNITSTSASSTFANGINLTSGCFAVNGTCVTGSGGSGSGTVNSGTTGYVAYYASDTTAVSATSSLFISTAGNVGIGTTTPAYALDVSGTDSDTIIRARGTYAYIVADALGSVGNSGFVFSQHGTQKWSIYRSWNDDALNFYNSTEDITPLIVLPTGNVGIGTTSPYAKLSVAGEVVASHFTATSTTATSTFAGGISIAGAAGLTVLQNGNVGVGTDSPEDQITIEDSVNPSLTFRGTAGNQGWSGTIRFTEVGGFGYLGTYIRHDSTLNTMALGIHNETDSLDANDIDVLTITRNDGFVGIGTTSPYAKLSVEGSSVLGNSATAGYFVGTTTATSTLAGGLQALALSITSTSASSTFANGINLTSGCFAVNGTCVTGSGGSGSGTVNSGTTGYVAYYASDTTAVSATSSLFISTAGNIGIGTSSPYAKLSVVGEVVASHFTATSTSATSSFAGGFDVGSGGLTYEAGSGITYINSLQTGPMSFDTDAGAVSWVDLPVTSASAAGLVQRYTAQLDGNPMITVSGIADGSGGLTNTGVGIGTTSPYAKLSVWGGTTGNIFEVVTSASTTALAVSATGFGTTTVTGLAINGSATTTSTVGINLTAGCFAINGTCLSTGGGSGSGTVNSGTTGYVAYYASDTTAVSATSSLFIASNGDIGIGTTSPQAKLDLGIMKNADGNMLIGRVDAAVDRPWGIGSRVDASTIDQYFVLNGYLDGGVKGNPTFYGSPDGGSFIQDYRILDGFETNTNQPGLMFGSFAGGAGQSGTINFAILDNGNVGVGTSSPYAKLSVVGNALVGGNLTATGTLAVQGTGVSSGSIVLDVDGQLSVENSHTSTSDFSEIIGQSIVSQLSNTATGTRIIGIDLSVAKNEDGVLTDVVGVDINFDEFQASTVTNAYGIKLQSFGNSFTNRYGIYLDYDNAATNDYAIYQVDQGVNSYFAGNLGIGTTSPYAKLSVVGEVVATNFTATSTTATSTFDGSFKVDDTLFQVDNWRDRVAIGTSTTATLGNNMLTIHTNTAGVRGLGVYQQGGTGTAVRFDADAANGSGLHVSNRASVGWALYAEALDPGIIPLHIEGVSTQTADIFEIDKGATRLVTVDADGDFGIGTTSPYAKLSVVGEVVASHFTATSTTATSSFAGGLDVGSGGLTYEAGSGITYISSLQTGPMSFDTDAGAVSWVDLPVTSTAIAGLAQSYTAQIDSNPVLTVYAESDGAGGIQNSRVGIGTTSPYAKLSVAGLIVGSHFNATTTTATSTFGGFIDVNGTGGTSTIAANLHVQGTLRSAVSYVGDLVFSNDFRFIEAPAGAVPRALYLNNQTGENLITYLEGGNIGIGTTTPEYKLHVIGDVAATSFVNISTEEAKTDIDYLEDEDKVDILEKIRDIRVAQYHYKNESGKNPLRLGLIAEESPSEILSVDGKGVDIYKLSTFVLAGVQEQQKIIDSLSERISFLESGVSSSTAPTSLYIATSSTAISSSTAAVYISSVVEYFETLGLKIVEGVAHFASIVTQSLTVGSKEKPSGITLFDEETGEPYCLKIKSGETVTTKGECTNVVAEENEESTEDDMVATPVDTNNEEVENGDSEQATTTPAIEDEEQDMTSDTASSTDPINNTETSSQSDSGVVDESPENTEVTEESEEGVNDEPIEQPETAETTEETTNQQTNDTVTEQTEESSTSEEPAVDEGQTDISPQPDPESDPAPEPEPESEPESEPEPTSDTTQTTPSEGNSTEGDSGSVVQ